MSKIDFPLIQLPIPTNQYVNQDTKKTQIFLHHTAGNGNPYGVVEWWNSNPEAISTSFLIARGAGRHRDGRTWNDGDVFQCFSSSKWGWHLGLKARNIPRGSKSSRALNADSIGIEICNFGQLVYRNGKFWAYPRNFTTVTIPADQVVEYSSPFRGYKFYQKYTDLQLENTRKLLLFLGDRWDIPLKYKGYDQLFNLSNRCFRGEPGVWSHTSVRLDKNDCHPQVELIQMLESL